MGTSSGWSSIGGIEGPLATPTRRPRTEKIPKLLPTQIHVQLIRSFTVREMGDEI